MHQCTLIQGGINLAIIPCKKEHQEYNKWLFWLYFRQLIKNLVFACQKELLLKAGHELMRLGLWYRPIYARHLE
ncbi:hypothetical protein ACZ76_01205 [Yersinia aleksiciae]|uniref:Transposase n=1 Tax=Yersinia aleksiciae TaxID=263819 RepID=A0ABM5U8Z1_YERAE|nr:hypothetical protein ACZ76_01205 [Yersinia aleksiciae]